MTIALGIKKLLAYKKESVYGVDPGATTAQLLRRVTSNVDLAKDTYTSNELRPDYQVADMRHGLRKVGGDMDDELSATTWKDFFAAVTRAAWVAGTTITTGAVTVLSSTAAASSTVPGFITTTGTSFITLGFRVGDAITMTGWATTMVPSNSRVFLIVALTATVMTIVELTGVANSILVTKVAGDTVTLLRSTSKTLIPLTGHTSDSFTLEHNYVDIVQSERFNGCRVNTVDLALPATGMATIKINVMGQNAQTGTTGYFTTPTAVTSTGVLAAVNGRLSYNGALVALITAAAIKIDAGMTTAAVVGSNQTPDVFAGPIKISGQLSVYFQDNSIRDDFWNENTPSMQIALASDNLATPVSYMIFNLPKIKLGAFTRADGPQGLVATVPFTGLLQPTVGANDVTSFSVQDSTF